MQLDSGCEELQEAGGYWFAEEVDAGLGLDQQEQVFDVVPELDGEGDGPPGSGAAGEAGAELISQGYQVPSTPRARGRGQCRTQIWYACAICSAQCASTTTMKVLSAPRWYLPLSAEMTPGDGAVAELPVIAYSSRVSTSASALASGRR